MTTTTFSTLDHLECGQCGANCAPDEPHGLCRACDRPLLPRYDLTLAAKTLTPASLAHRRRDLWRYHEVLPVRSEYNLVSLGEGCTPLLRATRLGEDVGCANLWIKDESQNPTGSFKARGMTTAISRARELGVTAVAAPSAGNAAGAMSAYAAAAGMKARVAMPADSGAVFFDECRRSGAEVWSVDGTISDCGERLAQAPDAGGFFSLATLKEPYRLEGKKTMGYELYEDFLSVPDRELPDVIVYPTGGGTGLIGMWKAFDEMERLGWITGKRPAMVSVQAKGCAPIVRAFANGAEFAEPFPNPTTAALGLRVPQAVGDFLILRAIRESGGAAVSVTEDEWAAGCRDLAAYAGLYASPEGGATVAALRALLGCELIFPENYVVLFNTGSGFKYPALPPAH